MCKVNFTILPLSVTGTPGFSEASREELRVLLALIECDGRAESEEALASLASTSRARCISSLAFWEEEGVISRADIPPEEKTTIVEEFEQRIRLGEIHETAAKDTAVSIRDEGLAAMIDECAAIMKRSAFSSEEVKELEALYSQLALSPEYITSLAAHLATQNGGRVTPTSLSKKALELTGKGISSFEELDAHIKMLESENATDREFRRALGIRGRALVPGELVLFRKWSEELGYSTEIVKEAYNRAVMATGERNLAYMDTLLTAWHEAGCRTVSECIANSEAFSAEQKQKAAPKRKKSKSDAPTPRYGDFDIDDAFEKALSRSFGDEK